MKSGTPIINNSFIRCCRPPLRGGAGRAFADTQCRPTTRHVAGFTLAEVLAALMFMAIVVPVAVQALRVAAAAGEVAARKAVAVRIAERVIQDNFITTNYNQSVQSGTIMENGREFRWELRSEQWFQDQINQMQILTSEVKFTAQDREHSVKLSTLVMPQ